MREAVDAEDPGRPDVQLTARTRRIVEIWSADEMVDWQIISRKHQTQQEAEIAEASVIAALEASQNGALLNRQAGMHGAEHGSIPREELHALDVDPVNPSKPYPAVFVFPIHRAIQEGRDVYDATCYCWRVAERWRAHENAVAVGLVRGQSLGAWQIENWQPADIEGRHVFDGLPLQDDDLTKTRWTTIINAARGYFQRGNWLVVEFDGQGKFRILRGSTNGVWQPLDQAAGR